MAWFQKKESGPVAPPKSGSAPKGVKVSSLLSEDVVLMPSSDVDKAGVLKALVSVVARKSGFADEASLLDKVLEREQGISTTLDTGLSLPHARVDGLDKVAAGMAVLKTPLLDPKQPDLPIRVLFLFFSPNKPAAFPLHLQLLRAVSSLFQGPLIDRLTAAAGPAAALELVRSIEG